MLFRRRLESFISPNEDFFRCRFERIVPNFTPRWFESKDRSSTGGRRPPWVGDPVVVNLIGVIIRDHQKKMILPITFIIEGMSYPSIHLYHYVGGGLPTFQLFFSPLAVASPRPAQLPPFCRRWHRPMQPKRKRSNGALTPCGRRRNFLRPAQGPSEREGSVGNILKIRKNSGAVF